MATRNSRPGDGKAANRLGLRVVGGEGTTASNTRSAAETGQTIFDDERSGRDRRVDAAQAAGKPLEESQRAAADRRRGQLAQGAWWLERDYVESHHFVQKSSGGRSRRSDEDTPHEE